MQDIRDIREPDPLAAYSYGDLAGPAAYDAAEPLDAFQTTVELTASGISHMDVTGRFLYVNPALCQLTGYSREELLGLTFQHLLHPDEVAETVESFRRLIAGEILVGRLEMRCFPKNGVVVWVSVNVTLRRTPSGAPQYVIAIIDDISERKRLEAQLRATNQQLEQTVQKSQRQANDMEAIFEAITDLVVVFDKQGHIQRTNRAARNVVGTPPTIEAGRQYLRLADVHGQPLPFDQLASSRVLRGETLTGDEAIDMLAHPDSGREIFFNISGAPVHDAQEQIVGGVVALRDVTERRRLERYTREALQALLRMAEALVAPVPSPAPVMPRGNQRVAASPTLNPVVQRLAELASRVLGCRRVGIVALEAGPDVMRPLALTGVPPELVADWCAGLQGRSVAEFIGADTLRRMRAGETVLIDLERQPMRSVAHGGPVALAVPLRLGDQLVGTMAMGYDQEPHTYTEDELALAAAVAQLIALVIERDRLLQEREEARSHALALQEANQRMEEFIGVASHELRTPLASVLGNMQLLERRLARTPPTGMTKAELTSQLDMVNSLLDPMQRQGRRLSRLVGDLVNAYRIKSGSLEFDMKPCDLATIVREEVEEQRQAAPEHRIDLTLPGDAPVLVIADADRIGQVVSNYLTNALKYSQEGQPVEVRLDVEGDTARVSVHDEGPGLPPEEQSRIWEEFHRAPDIRVQSGSGIGLGLGLHICKTFIERHHGQLGVESAIGRGSTFWFTLPLATNAKANAKPNAASRSR